MKNKLLILATLIATSIACFVMVDAFDRHSKSLPMDSNGASIDTVGALPGPTTQATGPQVARLMKDCTGRALARMETTAAALEASTASDGTMACCREYDMATDLAAVDHGCCATATPAP